MNTDCELEVEQDKRENSWTNTARFKPADLSPLLKGMVLQYVCGTIRERHRVCTGVQATKTLLMSPISEASREGSLHFYTSLSCLHVRREWRLDPRPYFSLFKIYFRGDYTNIHSPERIKLTA